MPAERKTHSVDEALTWVQEEAPKIFVAYYRDSPYAGKDGIPFEDMSDKKLASQPAHFLRLHVPKDKPYYRCAAAQAAAQSHKALQSTQGLGLDSPSLSPTTESLQAAAAKAAYAINQKVSERNGLNHV